MTFDERLDLNVRAAELSAAGRDDEAMALARSKPMAPWMAKIFKEKMGLEFLLKRDFNMVEVEDAYGKEWLSR
jgi:hypothetical protein